MHEPNSTLTIEGDAEKLPSDDQLNIGSMFVGKLDHYDVPSLFIVTDPDKFVALTPKSASGIVYNRIHLSPTHFRRVASIDYRVEVA